MKIKQLDWTYYTHTPDCWLADGTPKSIYRIDRWGSEGHPNSFYEVYYHAGFAYYEELPKHKFPTLDEAKAWAQTNHENVIRGFFEEDKPTFTTGHCSNHNQPGGCQLPNVHCGYPNCDRRPITA